MSDADMSTDSLDDCGVDLQFGDQTLDNLAGSLLACTGKTRHTEDRIINIEVAE